MRLLKLATAAGLVIATLGIGTAAQAKPHDRHGYHDGNRGHDRYDRHDRGRGHAWGRGHRGYGRQHCRIEYRHHHRVRVCR